MSNNLLKCVIIYRSSNHKLVAQHFIELLDQEIFKLESAKICESYLATRNDSHRTKLNTNYGTWFLISHETGLLYCVLAQPTYPDRKAFKLIEELQLHFAKLGNFQESDEVSLRLHIRKPLKELAVQYNEALQIEQIDQVMKQVEEVGIVMQENLKDVLIRETQLNALQDNMEKLKAESIQQNDKAQELQKIMNRRNLKLNVIVFLVGLTGIMYIGIPILIAESNQE